MHLIDRALQIAVEAYGGKTDKAGQPYILHPLRLMAKMPDETSMAVALLHDVVEDSDITATDLQARGIPDDVVNAVMCLTKRDGEDYQAFIERIYPEPLARAVKLADLEDNLNTLRLSALTDSDLRRIEKYHLAWRRLASPNSR